LIAWHGRDSPSSLACIQETTETGTVGSLPFLGYYDGLTDQKSTVVDAIPKDFENWINERALCPLRVNLGEPQGSWFAWMLHGDFIVGPNVPQGMVQAAADDAKASTSIRIASIGPNDTWLLIWEDGTMVSVLKDEYEDLQRKLEAHDVNDISVSRASARLYQCER
jgi:hypothetical protein